MNNINKKYYTLKELVPIVNIKYRQLLVRVKLVSKKYANDKKLINKKFNKWNIHFSLIENEFQRRRKKPINYILFATINSGNNFDKHYWEFIANDIDRRLKELDKKSRIKYVIEYKDGTYHLHFITSFGKLKQLKKLIQNHYLANNMNSLIKYVYDAKGLHKYFRKQYQPVLLK